MKLSKTSLVLLSAGIFIVVVASLGFTHSQQLKEQGQLADELGVAEKRLDKLQVKELEQQQEELQGQLDESIVRLTEVKDKMRRIIESDEVTEEFFEIAEFCDVEIENISSSKINTEKLQGITCSMINLSVNVSGEVSDLISFVIKLNNDFTTGNVRSTQISISETDEGEAASASIMMVVYTYEGD